jgi:vacuolar-type H+-ATPase subunit H
MAAIIKASESSESTVEFAFDDLGDPERSDLKNAGRRAAKMLAEAETQAAELYRQAEQQGRVAAQAAAQQVSEGV